MASRIHREVYVRFWREYGTVEVDDRLCLPHDLDIQVSKLKLLKANHTSQRYRLEDNIAKTYPMQIASFKERIEGYENDIQAYRQKKPAEKDSFSMKIGPKVYTEKKEAGTALLEMCRMAKQPNMEVNIGEFGGFPMSVTFDSFWNKFTLTLRGNLSHKVELGADVLGNLQRISNALEAMPGKKEELVQKLANAEQQLETAKAEVQKPFPKEAELQEKMERLAQLNALLNMDEKGDAAVVMEDEETEPAEPVMEPKAEKVAEEPLKPVASWTMSERIAEHERNRMLADGGRERISVKEKLNEMREKINVQKVPGKEEPLKGKAKEKYL